MNYLKPLLLSFLLISIFACSPRILEKPYDEVRAKQLYNASIADSAKPENGEISAQLQAILPGNTQLKWKKIDGEDYLLVATWISDSTFYGQIKPGMPMFTTKKYPTWVTVIPEMQERCQDPKFGRKEGLNLRLKQSLGLPPTTTKSHFAELWVNPKDLYRPCPDKEITDSKCGLCFPDTQDTTHIQWFNQQRLASYYNCDWNKNYPWTQLGYTYDWNKKNKNHQGLSEFIISPFSDVYPNGVYTTEDYCK